MHFIYFICYIACTLYIIYILCTSFRINSISRLFGKNAEICFTGQGSQYRGMGFNLYKNNKVAKRIVDEADAALGFKISDIINIKFQNIRGFSNYIPKKSK